MRHLASGGMKRRHHGHGAMAACAVACTRLAAIRLAAGWSQVMHMNLRTRDVTVTVLVARRYGSAGLMARERRLRCLNRLCRPISQQAKANQQTHQERSEGHVQIIVGSVQAIELTRTGLSPTGTFYRASWKFISAATSHRPPTGSNVAASMWASQVPDRNAKPTMTTQAQATDTPALRPSNSTEPLPASK